eukprot:625409-Rhodomonas_salina.5
MSSASAVQVSLCHVPSPLRLVPAYAVSVPGRTYRTQPYRRCQYQTERIEGSRADRVSTGLRIQIAKDDRDRCYLQYCLALSLELLPCLLL